jgi:hypothetical protein
MPKFVARSDAKTMLATGACHAACPSPHSTTTTATRPAHRQGRPGLMHRAAQPTVE